MKQKIGVMGGAGGNHSEENLAKAKEIGKAIAENDAIFFYGATIGLPLAAAKAAKEAGGLVVGVSPAANKQEHKEKYRFPFEPCDVVIFTGFGYQGRNVLLVRSCDAIIVIGGRVGTMSEFATGYAEQKPIGILQGTGGFADKAKEIEKEVLQGKKPTKIVYGTEPKNLVKNLLQELQE